MRDQGRRDCVMDVFHWAAAPVLLKPIEGPAAELVLHQQLVHGRACDCSEEVKMMGGDERQSM